MQKLRVWLFVAASIIAAVSVVACHGGGDSSTVPQSSSTGWAWMSGSPTVDQSGAYGVKGTASASNVPGARFGSMSWTDGNGTLWLFGGFGYESTGLVGELNDLWKFEPSTNAWTWVSGSNTRNQSGVYSTKGVADIGNIPGGREFAVTWVDGAGNLWLFGGSGYDSAGMFGRLSDLWMFEPSTGAWTWVSGPAIVNQQGVYGTKGTADAANIPGSREAAVSWIDGSGKLFLFGGWGIDSSGSLGFLNDLWKYDPSSGNWTWVNGANAATQPGVYGAQKVASVSATPGSRAFAVAAVDGNGDTWIFGGHGFDSISAEGELNDLWKYDPGTGFWTWMSGANIVNRAGVYGTKGIASVTTVPGSREGSVLWIDGSNRLWLFSGWGFDASGLGGSVMNDLWRYDISTGNWMWVGGSSAGLQPGVYGTKGVLSSGNVPGSRQGATGWADQSGRLWLFGGSGLDGADTGGDLNDLWQYQP